jgi:hypothetical protein
MIKKFVLLCLLSSSLFASLDTSAPKVFTKDELLSNVDTAIKQCDALIMTIDKRPASLWSPAIGILERDKKKRFEELKRQLSLNNYITGVADLKLKNITTKDALEKMINNSTDDLPKLNLKVSEDLRAFSSFCVGPVKMIKQVLDGLEALKK